MNPMPDGRHDDAQVNDYLWDRSGAPDAEVERLETLLAGARLGRREGPATPQPATSRRRRGVIGRIGKARALSIAATLVLAVGAAVWYARSPGGEAGGWAVRSVAGTPRVGERSLGADRLVPVGAWVETDGASSLSVDVADIGWLDVSPNSRLRIQETGPARHEVELAHGRIEATISAPPRLFFVQTRGAMATDMGCRYVLDSPETGPGLLTVTLGWVMLDSPHGWESRVPRGVRCTIDPQRGPGTPVRVRASQALWDEVTRVDAAGWRGVPDAAMETLLGLCGPDDCVTLWHMLTRVDEPRRAAVLDRISVLIGLPDTVVRDQVLSLNEGALDRLWSRVLYAD